MSYPNITAANVRDGIPHITSTLCSDARVLELVVEATRWIHRKMSGNVDLTAIKAYATTPPTWQEAIIKRCRALVLSEKYGTARTVNPADINGWIDQADEIVNSMIDGSQKLLDSNDVEIPTGINYNGISSNQDDTDPYFGLGDDGEYLEDKDDKTTY